MSDHKPWVSHEATLPMTLDEFERVAHGEAVVLAGTWVGRRSVSLFQCGMAAVRFPGVTVVVDLFSNGRRRHWTDEQIVEFARSEIPESVLSQA